MMGKCPKRGAGRFNRGFTLIELLTVVLIIGILMAMILGVVAYAHRINLESKAKADIETLRTALVSYQMDVGQYPANTPPATAWTNDVKPYIRESFTFIDPWGQFYVYTCSSPWKAYDLHSKGADRLESPPPEADADNIVAGRF